MGLKGMVNDSFTSALNIAKEITGQAEGEGFLHNMTFLSFSLAIFPNILCMEYMTLRSEDINIIRSKARKLQMCVKSECCLRTICRNAC